jgi:carboxylesterase
MIQNPELSGDPIFWKAGPVGVLLVHGFTATVAEVYPLAKRLHSAGFTVAAPLLPGHYTQPEELNRIKWREWFNIVERSYETITDHCRTVLVGGESAGGLLALYLASFHKEIAALLLYAPAVRLKFKPVDKIKLFLLAPFVRWVPKQNTDNNPLWQGYRVYPLKGAIQLLKLQSEVMQRLPQIEQPVLVVQGKNDPTVRNDVPEMVIRRIKSNIKEVHWMDRSSHCVILDCQFEQVADITLKFIHRVLGSHPEVLHEIEIFSDTVA